MRRLLRRHGPLAARLLAAVLAAPAPAAAQVAAAARDTAATVRHDFRAMAVWPHAWSPVGVVTLLLPHGSADDERELAGTAWLTAQAVRREATRRLDPGTVTVLADVGRTETVLQVLAPPDLVERAREALVAAAFSARLDPRDLEAARGDLLSAFRFEQGAPIRDFQSELYGFLAGDHAGWSHDPRGTSASLARIGLEDLEAYRSRRYRRGESVLTLDGAVDGEPTLRVHPGAGGALAPSEASGQARSAWDDGERRRVERDVTNAWIGAAFPVRSDVPETLLEFMEQRVREELNPVPPDPGLFGSEVRIERHPGGPLLVVETAVLPDALERWEEKVVRAVEELAERHEDPALFRWHRRRFRSTRLVEDGAPETRGRRLARDLLYEGRVRDVAAEIWALDSDALERAMDLVEEPRIVVYGPDLSDGGGSPPRAP